MHIQKGELTEEQEGRLEGQATGSSVTRGAEEGIGLGRENHEYILEMLRERSVRPSKELDCRGIVRRDICKSSVRGRRAWCWRLGGGGELGFGRRGLKSEPRGILVFTVAAQEEDPGKPSEKA